MEEVFTPWKLANTNCPTLTPRDLIHLTAGCHALQESSVSLGAPENLIQNLDSERRSMAGISLTGTKQWKNPSRHCPSVAILANS